MGVPKFYRWISERYPCLSEVVKEFQIPEFDNLYLDMNGIIHVCSHPDDNNPHFRITEEKIFRDIFHYLEFLFRMIKPRKVFFMAIDGVAPRAKMNQQRGRRFRSAREAEELERKARESGETLPTEKRFDSNCITPGTEFMVKLQEQLKYFVTSKMSADPLWHGVDVYLSGHETPGEGEHKIMDFIRQQKSQPDYDANTRHCLYGLDADLIMLGLTSHEPHFSLLREEVRFGGSKDKNKRPATPEETTFHLLHLSLMREYLDFEFESLKEKLPFGYDLERIIDDWVLMGFLVGNDFIPHLPHLHIQHDALPLLWKTYMNVLPECGGYLNDGGHLNLERFEKYMIELAKFDADKFEETFADLKWLETKVGGKAVNMEAANVADEIRARKMKKDNENMFAALQEDDDVEDDLLHVPKTSSGKTSTATTPMTPDSPDSDEDDINTFDEEFTLHKRHYYMTKMEFENVDKEVLRDQSEGYIRAIQWILLYYYEGVPSWSWFYPHHYAPYISDVVNFKDMNIEFDLSTPFLPFQQLMAVLPAASKDLLPEPYQKLMTQDYSPVIDFYPVNFQTDLNGKQQDWEAVVLIPFIEENRLLEAMKTVENKLSKEEKRRNSHGPCLLYRYTPEDQGPYPSSLPGSFPDVVMNHAKLTKIPLEDFIVDKKSLIKGLLPGVRLDVYFPGFPTLKHIPHRAFLKKDGVKVFQHSSKNDNMLLEILPEDDERTLSDVANDIIGKSIYVLWPHLFEAKVISVSDGEVSYMLEEQTDVKSGKNKKESQYSIKKETIDDSSKVVWRGEVKSLTDRYRDRRGILVGDTKFLLQAQPMIGRKYVCGSHGVITHEKQFGKDAVKFVHQATVKDISVHDPSFSQFKTLGELFPLKEVVFMLGWPHYGSQGEVLDVEEGESPRVRISVVTLEEPSLDNLLNNLERYCQQYFPGYIAAQRTGISSHFLSRITGSIYIKTGSAECPGEGNNVNIGLNMKFTKRNEEMPGYTKQSPDGWLYSQKAIDTVCAYLEKFPDVAEVISKSNNEKNKGDIFYEDDIFGKSSATLKQVQEYLKSLPSAQIKTMKSGTEVLDEGIIKAVEREVDRVVEANKKKCKRVKMQVKPHLLFRPIIGQGGQIPDQSAKFYLFDRVVNVRYGYSVPFGLRGTVVGIHKGETESDTILEVVFDEAFQGGITIRCAEGRGYRVPPAGVINITYGERKHGARADPLAYQQSTSNANQGYQQGYQGRGRGNHPINAWQEGQSSGGRGRREQRNYGNKQNYYSNYRDRNDNRVGYNDDYYNDDYYNDDYDDDYEDDYNYGGSYYNAGYQKARQYEDGVQRSPRGQQPYQRQGRRETAQRQDRSYDSNTDYSNKASKPTSKPQSLPLRQQSFDGTESSVPPMFVTPKVTGGHTPRRDSAGSGQKKAVSESSTSEFANMWKELQTGAPPDLTKPPPSDEQDNKGQSLSEAAEALKKMPSPLKGGAPLGNVAENNEKVEQNSRTSDASSQPEKGERKPVTLDALFQQASKVKAEEDQFTAMFNSLQMSAEQKEKEAKVKEKSEAVDDGTNLLKQMLKIGSENDDSAETKEEASTDNKGYGRQVSLQELFEGAKTQLPPNAAVAPAQVKRSPPKGQGLPDVSLQKQPSYQQAGSPPKYSKPYQKPQQHQAYHQSQGAPNRLPGQQLPEQQLPGQQYAHPPNQYQKRNPVLELKNWCQSVGLREPKYDFFGQMGRCACVVTLSNGARFQGSVTRSQEEAAESAAGATLLHVGAYRGPHVHPLMGGVPMFVQQPVPRQFSSPNSAFKPVSASPPGGGPGQYQNQRQYSHPPPSHFNQPNQFGSPRSANQQEDRRNQQQAQAKQNPRYTWTSGKRQGQERTTNEKQEAAANQKQDDKGEKSQANPFIPMQVTRKTPSKRRDSESENKETQKQSDQVKERSTAVRNILPENDVIVGAKDKSESRECESASENLKNGEVGQFVSQESKTPSEKESVDEKKSKQTPSGKQQQPSKRRTRIAANFNFGGS